MGCAGLGCATFFHTAGRGTGKVKAGQKGINISWIWISHESYLTWTVVASSRSLYWFHKLLCIDNPETDWVPFWPPLWKQVSFVKKTPRPSRHILLRWYGYELKFCWKFAGCASQKSSVYFTSSKQGYFHVSLGRVPRRGLVQHPAPNRVSHEVKLGLYAVRYWKSPWITEYFNNTVTREPWLAGSRMEDLFHLGGTY